MKTIMNIVRVILMAPFMLLLLLTLLVSPYVISLKLTLLNPDYIKNLATDQYTLDIIERAVFNSSEEEGVRELQKIIFSDRDFLRDTISSSIDSVFLWLERDTEEIRIVADRKKTENRYLDILYTNIQKDIYDKFGRIIDPSNLPVCENKDITSEQLQILFISGKPCLPMDFSKATSDAFDQLGLTTDSEKVTLLSVSKDDLKNSDIIRDGYWVVDNSIALTIGTVLTLMLIIILIAPKTTAGYILTGVLIFLVSSVNIALLSATPYVEFQDVVNSWGNIRDEITSTYLHTTVGEIANIIIRDISLIGRNTSFYFLLLSIAMFVGYWIWKKKRVEKI